MSGRHAKPATELGQRNGWLKMAQANGDEVGDRRRVVYTVARTVEGFVCSVPDVEMKVPRRSVVAWVHLYDDDFADLPIATFRIQPPAGERSTVILHANR